MNEDVKKRINLLFNNNESKLDETDSELVTIVGNFSQDEVVKVSMLTERERMLSILAVLLGCQGMGAYCNVLKTALTLKIDPVAIKEVVYQAVAYLGIGRTYDFLLKTNEIMQECKITLPLEKQATTDENSRFEKGLAKQIELFGPDMAKRQEGPSERKNINRWLADNCFGDYYTRKGLNDQEREMITFCFILAQGGCENQLKGHTAGNFNVGNDKEKLYQIVEQCMPYIGYPRSLNAMNIIDEVAENI